MGNSASSPEDELNDNNDDDDFYDQFDGIDTLGFRVLGVQPNSPASSAGLVSFLDFLVGADNKMLLGSGEDLEPGQEYDDVNFPALLDEKKGTVVELLVWNIKSQTARLVDIIPSDTWGGAGLLGVTIRIDNYAGAEDRLVRVLSIESTKSPAAVAGLVPEKDYLLGTTHQTLDSVDRLAFVLEQHEDEVVELYVYNTDDDMVRVVALLPTSSWEGSRGGLLGAEVGTGYLHRLPHTSRNTSGTSVERKVRYVDADKSRAISANVSERSQATSKGGAKLLEMEPQLEMEPAEEDDPDIRTATNRCVGESLAQDSLAAVDIKQVPPDFSVPYSIHSSNEKKQEVDVVSTRNTQQSTDKSTVASPTNTTTNSYGGASSPLPPPRQLQILPSAKAAKSPLNYPATVRYPPIPNIQMSTYPATVSQNVNPASIFSQPPPIQSLLSGSTAIPFYGLSQSNITHTANVFNPSFNPVDHGQHPFMTLPPPPVQHGTSVAPGATGVNPPVHFYSTADPLSREASI